MEMVEVIYLLVFIIMFQAYQIWRLQRSYEDIVDLVVSLHIGDITLSEEDDDEY